MGNTELEIWKNIVGFEGLYQISSLGRVKSLGNGGSNASKEKILKYGTSKDGYYIVRLCREGKVKTFKTHRLVAQAFIPNPNNYPCINHKDENKQNNCIYNLEWITIKQNCNYGTRNERIGKASKGRKHTQEAKDKISIALKGKILSQETKEKLSKPIVQIHQSGLIIGVYDSIIEVERELGIKHSNINHCLKGKRRFAGGFRWKYLTELKKAS